MAWTELGGERLRLFDACAEQTPSDSAPGTILDAGSAGLRIATGRGTLLLRQLQWPGGKPLPAAQAAQGRGLVGQRCQ